MKLLLNEVGSKREVRVMYAAFYCIGGFLALTILLTYLLTVGQHGAT